MSEVWKFRFNAKAAQLRGNKDQQEIIDALRAVLRSEEVEMQGEDEWLAEIARSLSHGIGYTVN